MFFFGVVVLFVVDDVEGDIFVGWVGDEMNEIGVFGFCGG